MVPHRMTTKSASQFRTLTERLKDPAFWSVSEPVEVIETHISCLFLAGEHAYKLKKPVDFGFVNFTTLNRRKHFCELELKLNRRLAPQLYLDVLPITGTASSPRLGGSGPVIDYVVKMVRFAQSDLLSVVEESGRLTEKMMDRLAIQIAKFHDAIPVADPETEYGSPSAVLSPALENFRQIEASPISENLQPQLDRLRHWTETEHQRRMPFWTRRKQQGFIRECHGDMHLGNMVLQGDEVLIFDCIEFNDSFRWIDLISELAFCVMDITQRGHPELAFRLLNRYLEQNGDYQALEGFRFYLCYRALVRAKVAAVRLRQAVDSDRQQIHQEFVDYLNLAEKYANPRRPMLLVMHGVSGSGKSYGADKIANQLQAIRIRSDVLRKRIAAEQGAEDLYSKQMTEATYRALGTLAQTALEARFSVVLDATFLEQRWRDEAAYLARQTGALFRIINVNASEQTLHQRIRERQSSGMDPSDADVDVLEAQLAALNPLSEQEQAAAIDVWSEQEHCWERLIERLEHLAN